MQRASIPRSRLVPSSGNNPRHLLAFKPIRCAPTCAVKHNGSFVNSRGEYLHTVTWIPEQEPKARLIWHHGLGEHSGRYDKVFKRMADAGIQVHSFDAHGHGMSEPYEEDKRALIMDLNHMVEDMQMYIKKTIDENNVDVMGSADAVAPLVPSFMGGHSLGGLVTCLTSLKDQARWKGIILSSAAIDCEWTPVLKIQEPILGSVAHLIPSLRIVPAVRAEDMSQDKLVVLESVMDPLCVHGGGLCVNTAKEILNGFRTLGTQYDKLRLPIFAQHGTVDRCTRLQAVKEMISGSMSDDAELYEVEGGYHELLHGPEWLEVVDRFVDWILERAVDVGDGADSSKATDTPMRGSNKSADSVSGVGEKVKEGAA